MSVSERNKFRKCHDYNKRESKEQEFTGENKENKEKEEKEEKKENKIIRRRTSFQFFASFIDSC